MNKNILIATISSLLTFVLTIFIVFSMNRASAELIVGDSNGINPGVVEMYFGSSIPDGYLLCDGRAVPRTTYANLFAAIGTTYGAGDGSTTFNLPNLNGRIVVGKNTATFNSLGKTGGSESITLTTANIPSHTHSIPALSGTAASAGAHTHSIPALSGTATGGNHRHLMSKDAHNTTGISGAGSVVVGSGSATLFYNGSYYSGYSGNLSLSVTTTANTSGSNGAHTHSVSTTASTTGSVGSGASFTNLQPYIVGNYIIKY